MSASVTEASEEHNGLRVFLSINQTVVIVVSCRVANGESSPAVRESSPEVLWGDAQEASLLLWCEASKAEVSLVLSLIISTCCLAACFNAQQ